MKDSDSWNIVLVQFSNESALKEVCVYIYIKGVLKDFFPLT